MQLSQDRANEIKRLLVERNGVDPKRVDAVGRGWDEPIGTDPDINKRSEQNRRVEVQWFTLE
jgi:NitT/TauT family transport system substrate-binding protein